MTLPPSGPPTPPRTVAQWIQSAAQRMRAARLCFENGLQKSVPEAQYLLAHALGLPLEHLHRHKNRPLTPTEEATLAEVLRQRLEERLPAHYITGEAWFAGLRFRVDHRVLLPRSRIENIFDDPEGFGGLLETARTHRILDLCTGSGALAVALAFAFPHARVDASDLSADALAVARINVDQHALTQRIRLIQSDLFQALQGERYHLIVTNPPYVPEATCRALPPEYRHEPRLALHGGRDGLDLVRVILREAPRHLHPHGLVLCEVGDDTEATMKRLWPDFPGEWLMFHFEASGVFAVHREPLADWAAHALPNPVSTPPVPSDARKKLASQAKKH